MILILDKKYIKKVWGGKDLFANINFKVPEKTGEIFLVSTLKNQKSIIQNGLFKGQTLSQFYAKNKNLFFIKEYEKFPLLLKIIGAKNDLSVQLHPNDKYSKMHENIHEKHESWYILDCKDDGQIVYDHNAENREKFIKLIDTKQWDKLITPKKIKKGYVIDIPPGTVHAIKADTLVYEIQQTSNTTFRIYDYDRLENGKKRKLHTEEAKQAVIFPQSGKLYKNDALHFKNNFEYLLLKTPHYSLFKVFLKKNLNIDISKSMAIITCIKGYCEINKNNFKAGDTFLLLRNNISEITGKGILLIIKKY